MCCLDRAGDKIDPDIINASRVYAYVPAEKDGKIYCTSTLRHLDFSASHFEVRDRREWNN
jgi:hypothetical protein